MQLQGRKYKNLNYRMDYQDYRSLVKKISEHNKAVGYEEFKTISALIRKGIGLVLKDMK